MPKLQRHLPLIIVAGLVLLAYHWIFSAFFPAANGHVGDDFSYFLPQLIAGYFWSMNNGALVAPWFSPGVCGGLPAFANPQNIFYSIPQWLTLFVSPLTAVYLTMLLFAGLGFVGTYLLLNRAFQISTAVAILGASLFAFNGFYSHHLLVGHLSFHAFMLIPLLAYLLLAPCRCTQIKPLYQHLISISLAAMILAYMVYSGFLSLMPMALICVTIIALIHHMNHRSARLFWPRLALAGIIGLALSAAKLSAGLAFMSHYPRVDYPLPGADGLTGLLTILFQGLFLSPDGGTVLNTIVNSAWQLTQPEFEFGISFVLFLFLLLAPVLLWQRRVSIRSLALHRYGLGIGVGLLMIIPLAINIHSPDWHELLKQIPLLQNSSNLLRWLAIYIPLLILFGCLCLDAVIKQNRIKIIIVAIAIPLAITQHALADREVYEKQIYSPGTIEQAYTHFSERGTPPSIKRNKLFVNEQKRIYMPQNRNDILVHGDSPMTCYEPLFGYRMENFPLRPLRPGPVKSLYNDHFNFKNPACYVFGEANQCQPGDHFRSDQAAELDALLSYRPFEFTLPGWQLASNSLSIATLLGLLLFWLAMLVHLARSKLKSKSRQSDKP